MVKLKIQYQHADELTAISEALTALGLKQRGQPKTGDFCSTAKFSGFVPRIEAETEDPQQTKTMKATKAKGQRMPRTRQDKTPSVLTRNRDKYTEG